MRVDAEKEAILRAKIEEEVVGIAKELRTEIQDSGEFLLVHIVPKEDVELDSLEDALLRVRRILVPAIPPRVGLHSWMILVSQKWASSPVDHAVFSEILDGEIDES